MESVKRQVDEKKNMISLLQNKLQDNDEDGSGNFSSDQDKKAALTQDVQNLKQKLSETGDALKKTQTDFKNLESE